MRGKLFAVGANAYPEAAMRILAISAFALAAIALLASFTLPHNDAGSALASVDTHQLTIDGAAIPVAPPSDAH